MFFTNLRYRIILLCTYIISAILFAFFVVWNVELLRDYVDHILPQKDQYSFIVFVVIFLCNSSSASIVYYLNLYLEQNLQNRIIMNVNTEIYQLMLNNNSQNFSENVKDLLQSINKSKKLLSDFVLYSMKLGKILIVSAILMGLILDYNVFLGLLVAAFCFIMWLTLSENFYMHNFNVSANKILGGYNDKFSEIYADALKRDKKIDAQSEVTIMHKVMYLQSKINKDNFYHYAVGSFAINLSVTLFIFFGGFIMMSGKITLGEWFGSLFALYILWIVLQEISGFNLNFIYNIKAIYDIQKACNAYYDKNLANEGIDDKSASLVAVRGGLEFSNVSCSVNNVNILDEMSFVIQEKKSVAFVIWNDSTKMALLDLLIGSQSSYQGDIMLDGSNVKELRPSLLSNSISVVSKSIFLFDDTIYANIACAKIGANKQEIMSVSKLSGVHDFVTDLPLGYNTKLGEGGFLLDDSRRISISIARALLRDVAILLLYDLNVSILGSCESIAISHIMKRKTNILIVDKPVDILNADWIYVVDRGKVVEQGSHSHLITLGGIYASVYLRDVKEFKDFC